MSDNKKIMTRCSGFPVWVGYLLTAVVCVGLTLLFSPDPYEAGTRAYDTVSHDTGDVVSGGGSASEVMQDGISEGSRDGTSEGPRGDISEGSRDSTSEGPRGDISVDSQGGISEGSRGSRNVFGENGRITFIDNWFMDTRVKFVLDGIWHRMGNLNEILDTVGRIRHTSELSWFREWYKTAERIRRIGDQCLEKGHKISAGEAYLRAANYYLTAEVMLHTNPDDPRIAETYRKGGEYFTKAMELLSMPAEEVWIPYEGISIKGYFFRTNSSGKAPILLVHQGYDAPVEATKHIAEEAVRRGYHCLLFEGPGQGMTIRGQNIPLRADWENVVSPVIDYALTDPGVDEDNIILMGISMGGGFAVRAAAFEPRLKLCIVNPGYVNIYGIISDYLTPELINLYEEDPQAFNEKIEEIAGYEVGIRWGIYHGMWVFGADTPSGFLDNVKKFDYTDIIGKIRCRMLVMDGTSEQWGKGQARELYDMLDCQKEYMLFTEEDSASEHCQVGAGAIATQRMFDWLDENLRQ
jgi:dienelactone hydrolase